MDEFNTPNDNEPIYRVSPMPPEQPKENWFSAHFVLGLVFLVVVGAAIVAGIYYWKTTQQIPSTTQFPVHQEQTNANEQWKTYSNTQYGFEFQYPSDWLLSSDGEIAVRKPTGGEAPYVAVSISKQPVSQIVQKVLSGIEPEPMGKLISDKQISFAGVSAREIVYATAIGADFKSIIFTKLGNTFEIITLNNDSLLSQILSTFKFAVSSPPANPQLLVQILSHGGLCVTGSECKSVSTISMEGEFAVDGTVKGDLTATELANLKQAVETANYALIKSKKFTGTCPTAYDGQEVLYNFFTTKGMQDVDNCVVTIDYKSTLFKQVQDIVTKYSK